MSLCRFAIRHAVVEALRGRTIVGDNVKNSDFEALDIASDGEVAADDQPFILVYTDDSASEGAGMRTLWENGTVEVVIEFGIAQAMSTHDDETGETVLTGFAVPATDTGMEAALDITDRQIAVALHGDGQWPNLFSRMHDGITKIERKRATLSEGGTRLAARQVRIWVAGKSDPVWGAPLATTSVWKQFEAAVAGSGVEAITAALLGVQDAELTLEHIRERFGLSDAAAPVLGIDAGNSETVTGIVWE
ncbi:hypothetical protein [Palleronia sp.]|uniref:hypothetical protein n=1 Tax=Palleronia sp. TaxID=1940284 RepID=UPI0035C7AE38